jgi:hypothetical protein
MKYHSYQTKFNKYQNTYAIYNKGDYAVIGGFWDGSLILLDYDNKIQFILNPSYDESNKENQWMKPMIDSNLDISPIVYICISKDNLSAYCGTLNGTLYSFEIEEFDINTIYYKIAEKRGCFLKNQIADIERINRLFLKDFRSNCFGGITLDEE